MGYTKPWNIDPGSGGDTVYSAVLKIDWNIDELFDALNGYEDEEIEFTNKTLISPVIQGGSVTDDISVGDGVTVDGRDLSVDGSKLDTVEDNAVALSTVKSDSDIAAAIAHASVTSGNPHNVTKSDVGLGNVTNDAQVAKSIGTAKGDLILFTASGTPVRLAVGSNGQVLLVDSTEETGVKWGEVAAGAGLSEILLFA